MKIYILVAVFKGCLSEVAVTTNPMEARKIHKDLQVKYETDKEPSENDVQLIEKELTGETLPRLCRYCGNMQSYGDEGSMKCAFDLKGPDETAKDCPKWFPFTQTKK